MHASLVGIIALCAVLGAAIASQALSTRLDYRRRTRDGRFLDLADGGRVFVCDAGQSGPSVVFESGITASSLHWAGLQAAISLGARTLSYDRRGLGWSSPCKEAPTPAVLARELHAVLRQTQLPSPYLLVAHSFGGLIARTFAAEYPDEVSGMVLLDPMRPEEWQPSNDGRQKLMRQGILLMRRAIPLARLGIVRVAAKSLFSHPDAFAWMLGAISGKGGLRMVERTTRELGKMPAEARSGVIAQWSTAAFYRGAVRYFEAVNASVAEMEHVGPSAGIPVVLLTPASTHAAPDERLRRIGTNVRQQVIQESGHWVHLDQPVPVQQAIWSMVEGTAPDFAQSRQAAFEQPTHSIRKPEATHARHSAGVHRHHREAEEHRGGSYLGGEHV